MTKKSGSSESLFQDRVKTCYICGKEFISAPEHIYKLGSSMNSTSRNIRWYCSYKCYVKDLKKLGRW